MNFTKSIVDDAAADAKFLAAMCTDCVTVYTDDGVSYWYYFVADSNNCDVIKFLFHRNGLSPRYQLSRLYPVISRHYNSQIALSHSSVVGQCKCVVGVYEHPVFRIDTRQLSKNPRFAEFTYSVEASVHTNNQMTPAILEYLRAQMRRNKIR